MIRDDRDSGRFVRFATTGAVAFCTVFPLLQIAVIAEAWDASYTKAAWAVAATACYLPLHVWHARYAVRGLRPPGGAWTLAAMAVIIVGVTPLAGSVWLPSLHALVVSALFVLRPPWSLLTVAAVVALTLGFALTLETTVIDAGSYYTVTVMWRSSSVFVPVWLVGTIRQLEAARRALAEEAVVRERVRIDDELRRTLGSALDDIAARGQRAVARLGHVADRPDAGDVAAVAGSVDTARLDVACGHADVDGADASAGGDVVPVQDELRALVDGSRRTLAEARQMITGYQQSSLQAELDVAASLLTAAGIDTRVVRPAGDLPETVDGTPRLRAALRSATARLLRDPAARACVITVTRHDHDVRLDVRRGDAAAPSPEAAAS